VVELLPRVEKARRRDRQRELSPEITRRLLSTAARSVVSPLRDATRRPQKMRSGHIRY
jgi:hypothetical protein